MKYIALIYAAPGTGPQYGTPEFGPWMQRWQDITDEYIKAGVMAGGEALKDTDTATTVRVRNGKAETMDGPFAETKEHLGGYYVFECENLDEAIKWASKIPAVEYGCVEVRPIDPLDGM